MASPLVQVDPYDLYRRLPDPERRLMTLTVFGQLAVDTRQIVDHQLNPPFADLLDAQQRLTTSTKTQHYQRTTGQLDATEQVVLAELEADMQQGTNLAADALLDELLPVDLLELSLFKESELV